MCEVPQITRRYSEVACLDLPFFKSESYVENTMGAASRKCFKKGPHRESVGQSLSFEIKVCLNCNAANEVENTYCNWCGSLLVEEQVCECGCLADSCC